MMRNNTGQVFRLQTKLNFKNSWIFLTKNVIGILEWDSHAILLRENIIQKMNTNKKHKVKRIMYIKKEINVLKINLTKV